jgi:hypothetical protein
MVRSMEQRQMEACHHWPMGEGSEKVGVEAP